MRKRTIILLVLLLVILSGCSGAAPSGSTTTVPTPTPIPVPSPTPSTTPVLRPASSSTFIGLGWFRSIIFDGQYIWAIGGTPTTKFDPKDNRVIFTTKMPGEIYAATYDGKYSWSLATPRGQVLAQIQPDDGAIIRQVELKEDFGYDIEYVDGRLWIPMELSSGGYALIAFGTKSLAQTAKVSVSLGWGAWVPPKPLTYDGNNLWVAQESSLLAFNPSTGEIARRSITGKPG